MLKPLNGDAFAKKTLSVQLRKTNQNFLDTEIKSAEPMGLAFAKTIFKASKNGEETTLHCHTSWWRNGEEATESICRSINQTLKKFLSLPEEAKPGEDEELISFIEGQIKACTGFEPELESLHDDYKRRELARRLIREHKTLTRAAQAAQIEFAKWKEIPNPSIEELAEHI